MDLNTIQIHQGVGDIRFGMTKDEILEKFGEVQQCIEEEDEDGDIDLIFPELELTFSLWKEYDYRLGHIETEREDLTLLGESLFGRDMDEIREFIKDKLKAEISEEDCVTHDDGDLQEWIEVDDKDISFWFLNDALIQVSWLCDWVDGEEPNWPQTN